MRGIKKMVAIVTIMVFTDCTTEPHKDYEDVAKRSNKYFEEDQKKGSSDFVFPDSVLNKHIIATYFEEEAGAHSVMFYTDTVEKIGRVIRYFPDKTVLIDRIKRCGDKQFVSIPRPEINYLLDVDRVFYSCWRGDNRGFAFSFEHMRTDKYLR